MESLQSIYVAAAIFGAAILIIDLFGVLSAIGEDGDHADNGHADEGHADDGHDAGGHDEATGEHGSSTDDSGHEGAHDKDGAAMMHHSKSSPQVVVAKIIGWLKSLVYFALGFGAVGWFALATGYSAQASLLWSVGVGLVTLAIAKLVKRMQRHELNTEFARKDLLMAEAEVLITIGPGQIGKIRVRHEGINIDRFARAQDPTDSFPKGAKVRVLDIDDEYFFVGLV